jgi:hypothetical protein
MNHQAAKRPVVPAAIVVLLIAATAIPSDDPPLTLACALVVGLAVYLLWQLGEPPSLLLVAGAQLCQVATPLIYANVIGAPLQTVSQHIGDLTTATWFGLAAMACLTVGMWLGQLGQKRKSPALLQAEILTWTPEEAFRFCLVTLGIATVCDLLAAVFEPTRQLFLALDGLQWLGIFVLTCVCVGQWRGFKYLLLVVGFQVVIGFTGFFSGYKYVFVVALVGILSVRRRLKASAIVTGAAVCVVLVVMSAFWSGIKNDYRLFISEGAPGDQTVRVSFEDRVDYLVGKVADADWEAMKIGFDKLVKRVGYVDFLSATLRHIPERLDYQHGARIGAAIMHVLQPRILFPDKPPLPSDTAVTAMYTGLPISQESVRVSISIGYLGELYADFGIAGALFGTFLLGVAFGYAYRSVCASPTVSVLLSYGLTVMLLLPVAQFEQALTKTIGVFLTTLIAVLLSRRFLLPRLVEIFGPGTGRRRTRRLVTE